MKPLSFLTLIGTLFFFSSCHPGSSSIALTDASMYVVDTVRMAVAGGDEKAAQRKLQEASALFKKGSDTAGSIRLFKSAILLKPTAKAYFDLAGALLATRQYSEGLKALDVAEALGYTPLANVMFRDAYAWANIPDSKDARTNADAAVQYMELAIQMGYAHPRQFLSRTMFPNLSTSYNFDAVYTSVLSGGTTSDPKRSLWDGYEGQFPELQLPLVINRTWMQNHKREVTIDLQYERFIPELREARFSREGGNTYYYVGLIRKDPAYIAVLYCEASEMGDDTPDTEPLYTLVTYDRQGRIIDKMAVAGLENIHHPFLVFNIQQSLQFSVQEFAKIYKNDPDSAGYDSSNFSREDARPPVEYRIAASGKFEKIGAPMALR